MTLQKQFDVIIVGGSYAGTSAAMALGRALMNVLIVDNAKPCNRFTPNSHNLIMHDGDVPADMATLAKEQVLKYPTINWVKGTATAAERNGGSFKLTVDGNDEYTASKLLFATGVKDIMPDIEGFADCWGKSILHCPYCHGYEVRQKRTALLLSNDHSLEFAILLSNWTDELTLLTNENYTIPAEKLLQFEQKNIEMITSRIKRIHHANGNISSVEFSDRTELKIDAMYAHPVNELHCKLPIELGCDTTDFGLLEVNPMQHTTIEGVYAAGDITTPLRSVSVAIAAGTMAGASISKALVAERK